ncbi:hypothetical protein GQ42DRAFT_165211 [Ramicandelaber brevisporus]|nr:hypothetical protein GQ42DRAFT_165211 [Ramicandelaber brevisporus]
MDRAAATSSVSTGMSNSSGASAGMVRTNSTSSLGSNADHSQQSQQQRQQHQHLLETLRGSMSPEQRQTFRNMLAQSVQRQRAARQLSAASSNDPSSAATAAGSVSGSGSNVSSNRRLVFGNEKAQPPPLVHSISNGSASDRLSQAVDTLTANAPVDLLSSLFDGLANPADMVAPSSALIDGLGSDFGFDFPFWSPLPETTMSSTLAPASVPAAAPLLAATAGADMFDNLFGDIGFGFDTDQSLLTTATAMTTAAPAQPQSSAMSNSAAQLVSMDSLQQSIDNLIKEVTGFDPRQRQQQQQQQQQQQLTDSSNATINSTTSTVLPTLISQSPLPQAANTSIRRTSTSTTSTATTDRKWTQNENIILCKAIKEYNDSPEVLQMIALKFFPGRTAEDCRKQLSKLQKKLGPNLDGILPETNISNSNIGTNNSNNQLQLQPLLPLQPPPQKLPPRQKKQQPRQHQPQPQPQHQQLQLQPQPALTNQTTTAATLRAATNVMPIHSAAAPDVVPIRQMPSFGQFAPRASVDMMTPVKTPSSAATIGLTSAPSSTLVSPLQASGVSFSLAGALSTNTPISSSTATTAATATAGLPTTGKKRGRPVKKPTIIARPPAQLIPRPEPIQALNLHPLPMALTGAAQTMTASTAIMAGGMLNGNSTAASRIPLSIDMTIPSAAKYNTGGLMSTQPIVRLLPSPDRPVNILQPRYKKKQTQQQTQPAESAPVPQQPQQPQQQPQQSQQPQRQQQQQQQQQQLPAVPKSISPVRSISGGASTAATPTISNALVQSESESLFTPNPHTVSDQTEQLAQPDANTSATTLTAIPEITSEFYSNIGRQLLSGQYNYDPAIREFERRMVLQALGVTDAWSRTDIGLPELTYTSAQTSTYATTSTNTTSAAHQLSSSEDNTGDDLVEFVERRKRHVTASPTGNPKPLKARKTSSQSMIHSDIDDSNIVVLNGSRSPSPCPISDAYMTSSDDDEEEEDEEEADEEDEDEDDDSVDGSAVGSDDGGGGSDSDDSNGSDVDEDISTVIGAGTSSTMQSAVDLIELVPEETVFKPRRTPRFINNNSSNNNNNNNSNTNNNNSNANSAADSITVTKPVAKPKASSGSKVANPLAKISPYEQFILGLSLPDTLDKAMSLTLQPSSSSASTMTNSIQQMDPLLTTTATTASASSLLGNSAKVDIINHNNISSSSHNNNVNEPIQLPIFDDDENDQDFSLSRQLNGRKNARMARDIRRELADTTRDTASENSLYITQDESENFFRDELNDAQLSSEYEHGHDDEMPSELFSIDQMSQLRCQMMQNFQIVLQAYLTESIVRGSKSEYAQHWNNQLNYLDQLNNHAININSQTVHHAQSQQLTRGPSFFTICGLPHVLSYIRDDSTMASLVPAGDSAADNKQRASKLAPTDDSAVAAFQQAFVKGKAPSSRAVSKPVELPPRISTFFRALSPILTPELHLKITAAAKVTRVSFATHEDILIMNGIRFFGTDEYDTIRSHLLPLKQSYQIENRISNLRSRRAAENPVKRFILLSVKPLTLEEEEMLRQGVARFGNRRFNDIKNFVRISRPWFALRDEWRRLIDSVKLALRRLPSLSDSIMGRQVKESLKAERMKKNFNELDEYQQQREKWLKLQNLPLNTTVTRAIGPPPGMMQMISSPLAIGKHVSSGPFEQQRHQAMHSGVASVSAMLRPPPTIPRPQVPITVAPANNATSTQQTPTAAAATAAITTTTATATATPVVAAATANFGGTPTVGTGGRTGRARTVLRPRSVAQQNTAAATASSSGNSSSGYNNGITAPQTQQVQHAQQQQQQQQQQQHNSTPRLPHLQPRPIQPHPQSSR